MALSDADVQKQVKIAVKLWKFVDDEKVKFFCTNLLKFDEKTSRKMIKDVLKYEVKYGLQD